MASGEITRELPRNLEAEQAVLGALLFDNRAAENIGALAPGHFFEPFHQRLYEIVVTTVRRGMLAEPVTILERLKRDVAFEQLGGLRYLADLMDRAPPAITAPEYARVIVDLAMRRQMIRLGAEIAKSASEDFEHNADALIIGGESGLVEIQRSGGVTDHWINGAQMADGLDRLLDGEAQTFLPTGLRELDSVLGGFRYGRVTALAGRAKMGKSTVIAELMRLQAEAGRATGLFSLEMDDDELRLRMACSIAYDRSAPKFAGVSSNPNYFAVARRRASPADIEKLRATKRVMREWPFFVDKRPALAPSQIVPAAKRLIRQWERDGLEPGFIAVDHLHIVKPDKDWRGNRVAEVGEISGALRDLAKETGIPIVALCQLSRSLEDRSNKDKRPQVSDLRWAGEIEQDVAAVVFLYRPEVYLKKPDRHAKEASQADEVLYRAELAKVQNRLELIVGANRGGPTGEAEVFCDIGCSVVRDWDPGPQSPDDYGAWS